MEIKEYHFVVTADFKNAAGWYIVRQGDVLSFSQRYEREPSREGWGWFEHTDCVDIDHNPVRVHIPVSIVEVFVYEKREVFRGSFTDFVENLWPDGRDFDK